MRLKFNGQVIDTSKVVIEVQPFEDNPDSVLTFTFDGKGYEAEVLEDGETNGWTKKESFEDLVCELLD